MVTIKEYKMVESLEEAYVLNQKRSNAIIGGTHWLKMGDRAINIGIDLSHLGLDKIIETEDTFIIGAMTSLRDIELHKGLNAWYGDGVRNAMKHIVGIQLRNTATIGGSIYMRFGFSDVLTLFLALQSDVELYKGGVISLDEYSKLPYDRDIVVKLIVKKQNIRMHYLSMRNTETDLPTITCAMTYTDAGYQAVIGARPKRAIVISDKGFLSNYPTEEEILAFVNYVQSSVGFDSNHRGSKVYREHLCGVLVRRGIQNLKEETRWR